MTPRRSHTTVVSPARARYAAATSPLWPPPTTTTSALAVTVALLPQLPLEDAVYIVPSRSNGARIVDPSQDTGRTVIAVAQLAITVAEPDANRQAAADAVAEAAAAGARLVVLPELCDSGYVFDGDAPVAEARGLAAPAAD